MTGNALPAHPPVPVTAEPVASNVSDDNLIRLLLERKETLLYSDGTYRKENIPDLICAHAARRLQELKRAHPPVQPTAEFIVALQRARDWLQGSEPHRAQYIGEVLAKYPPVQPTEPVATVPADSETTAQARKV